MAAPRPCRRVNPRLHIGNRAQAVDQLGMLGVHLVLDMETGNARAHIAAGDVEGIGHGFTQCVGIGHKRYGHGIGNALGLFQLFHLTENTIVGHGVMKGAAGMAAKIGRLETHAFNNPPGQRAIGLGGDEMFASPDQIPQFLRHACHFQPSLVEPGIGR